MSSFHSTTSSEKKISSPIGLPVTFLHASAQSGASSRRHVSCARRSLCILIFYVFSIRVLGRKKIRFVFLASRFLPGFLYILEQFFCLWWSTVVLLGEEKNLCPSMRSTIILLEKGKKVVLLVEA